MYFSTKVLIADTIFFVSYWRRDRHFTWSSEPREGTFIFLSYFKTLSVGPLPGIEPGNSRSAVKRSTDWANPAKVGNESLHVKVKQRGTALRTSPKGVRLRECWLQNT